ncbi:hypothetical protein AVT69_gp113 [Pseudomonas phage PhiPA3]|uniref:Uncharacterized protein 114 n=1 Tax=Pseudomonas phage PhiPA3 TaxID=998086 RepID=F8SJY9_BPPA3|nr:hypothetical protein AVT69_gp113 [Pseudomonas phage PhiPA3]AEH03538.1 hypothetical protein [Pseudomonas phage PhiPA3]
MIQQPYRRTAAEFSINQGTEQKQAAGFTSAYYVFADIKGDTMLDWIEYQMNRLMPLEVRNHNHSYKDMFWMFHDQGLFKEPVNAEFFYRIIPIHKRRFRKLLRRVAGACRIKGGGYKGVDCMVVPDAVVDTMNAWVNEG